MLDLQRKRHIRFATIENASAYVVVAIVVETNGSETIALTDPKIVKIIPKETRALTGSTSLPYLLDTSKTSDRASTRIVSPYISFVFGCSNTKVISGLAPQPPTSN